MKKYIIPVICILMAAAFSGCQKWKGEHMDIYSYTPPAANPVSDKAPLSCSSSGSTVIPVKGTMLTGKTYTVEDGCDLVINPTDTLLLQPGVRLNMGLLVALEQDAAQPLEDCPESLRAVGPASRCR